MRWLVTVLTAALVSAGIGHAPPDQARPDSPLVYKTPGMDQVRVKRDLTYKKLASTEFQVDLFLPAAQGKQAPVVMLISGNSQPRKVFLGMEQMGRVLAANGIAAVLFDKRYQRAGYYDAEQDMTDLTAFLHREADELGLDMSRVCHFGYSGGGPLLSIALRPGSTARCVVGYYPMMDSDVWGAPADSRRDQAMRDFSPVQQIAAGKGKTPPVFLVRAGIDNPELLATIERFVRESIAQNADLTFLNYPQGHHAFDIRDDNDQSRAVIKATVEFLERQLNR
ncbi:MAG TPA: alpha/beta hydrolase [Gemmatimonadales bacterium]|nr:alpha/beta hydrolase [Gemmatimonadales bacterium]